MFLPLVGTGWMFQVSTPLVRTGWLVQVSTPGRGLVGWSMFTPMTIHVSEGWLVYVHMYKLPLGNMFILRPNFFDSQGDMNIRKDLGVGEGGLEIIMACLPLLDKYPKFQRI